MSVIIQSRPRSTITIKQTSSVTLVKSLPTDLSGLQTQIDAINGELSTLQTTLSGVQTDLTALQSDVSSNSSDITALQNSVANIQTDISTLQGGVLTALSQINALQSDLSDTQTDVSTLQSQVATLQSQVSTIQGQITTINGNISTLQSNVSTLQTDVSGALNDIDTLQSSVSTLQSNVSTLQGQVSTINTTLASLQNQINGLDDRLDTAESDINTLETNVSTNTTSINTINNNIKGIVAKEVQVLALADLPAPVSGVITLPNERKIYKFYNQIDLQGNTLRTGENTFEAISQNDSGVSNGTIEILETLTVRFFQFIGCTITINTNTGAYDWETVNFTDCILNAQNFNNIVFKTIGFFGNTTMNVSGTFNSLIISPNCIFSGATASNHTYFKVANTAVCNRRIRIEDTVFTTGDATQKAIEVITGASIPTESFILDDINFSGTGTALTGINGNDSQNRALFGGCKGGNVINTSPNAYYTMINNAVATPVSLATPTKILGTTIAQPITQLFDLSVSNRAIYKGVVPRVFKITALLSFTSGNNNQIGVYVAKNGVIVENFEPYVTTNGVGRAENAPTQEILQLNTNDYIEIWIENDTSATAVTVQSLTVILNEV